MVISGFQKLTLVDYPKNIACLIFTQGCNFRCPFCHNSDLLDNENSNELISLEEIFSYLNKRKGVLDGVCISGGEPLLQKDIESFMKSIKDLGYKIKLDTNGSNPKLLKKLIDAGLVDYVAMDIKNSFSNYDQTAGVSNLKIDNIKESINILKKSKIDFEFRTTIAKELHTFEDIKSICEYIGSNINYYVQNYRDCENVLERRFNSFSNEELLDIEKKLKKDYPNICIRGMK